MASPAFATALQPAAIAPALPVVGTPLPKAASRDEKASKTWFRVLGLISGR